MRRGGFRGNASKSPKLDLLVLAPHPDDAELGMAGTILKCKAEGLSVGVLDLTDGEPTPFGSREIRKRETDPASEILGLDWRMQFGTAESQPGADARGPGNLAGVIRLAQPKWLFAPYWVDAHPDHVAAVELIEAARFWAKLTKTDLPGQPHHPSRIFHYRCVHLRVVEPSGVRARYQRILGAKLAALRAIKASLSSAGRPSRRPCWIACATRRPIGAGRSAPATAKPLIVARPSG